MTIPLVGDGGLFTRLGKLAKLLRDANVYAAATLTADAEAAALAFDGDEDLRDLAALIPTALASAQSAADGLGRSVQSLAQSVLLRMVNLDAPQASAASVSQALAELVRQMRAAAYQVKRVRVDASAEADPANAGDGVIVVSTLRGDGRPNENLFAEQAPLTCTADSQSGTALGGREPFRFAGDQAVPSALSWNWPAGSGGAATVVATDPDAGLTANGDFESFEDDPYTPDNWAVVSGVAGTDFAPSALALTGDLALAFRGTGTPWIEQVFGDAAGTVQLLSPYTQYAVCVWVRAAAGPVTGGLSLELRDAAQDVTADAAGNLNRLAIDLADAGPGYRAFTATFRTPRVLASGPYRLAVRVSAAMGAGQSVVIDRLAFTPMVTLYPGGPAAAVFSGAAPFVVGDSFTLTTDNDRGDSEYNSTWQTFFDRVLSMRQMNALLPSGDPAPGVGSLMGILGGLTYSSSAAPPPAGTLMGMMGLPYGPSPTTIPDSLLL